MANSHQRRLGTAERRFRTMQIKLSQKPLWASKRTLISRLNVKPIKIAIWRRHMHVMAIRSAISMSSHGGLRPTYNLFRRKGYLDLFCAVPEDYPVPAFIDGDE